MTAPPHYAIGAASALFIQKYLPAGSGDKTRVACALGVAILSHVAADAIPHAEHFFQGRRLALELVVETVVMLAVLVGASRSPLVAAIILAGMAGGALPDSFAILSRIIDLPVFSAINDKIQFYHGVFTPLYANLWVQVVITVLCSIYVRIKSA
jgi:hypothetical protein